MSTHSASETIQQFQSIFAELGVPRHLHCDRGSNYTSIEFQSFMQGLNVKLSYSSSEFHSSNYAERSVQVVKGFMKRSVEWPICLLEYLMTPIRHQGVDNSPLKLMQKKLSGIYYLSSNRNLIWMTMKDIMPGKINRPNTKLVNLYKSYLKVLISSFIVKEKANGYQVS